ncbi:hypothetical protein OXX69_005275 [Metschnikowia pulcherrima]
MQVTEEDYRVSGNDFIFPELNLTQEDVDLRQTWIVDSILRIWVHQPQVAFLILEYLIEFRILNPQLLIRKALSSDHNLIINNVSCMESMNRVLSGSAKSESFQDVILLLFSLIVDNLNATLKNLAPEDPVKSPVQIIKDFSNEDVANAELMKKIDLQWLFYEYKGLLKTYVRKFNLQYAGFAADVKQCFEGIENEPVRTDALRWIVELDY